MDKTPRQLTNIAIFTLLPRFTILCTHTRSNLSPCDVKLIFTQTGLYATTGLYTTTGIYTTVIYNITSTHPVSQTRFHTDGTLHDGDLRYQVHTPCKSSLSSHRLDFTRRQDFTTRLPTDLHITAYIAIEVASNPHSPMKGIGG